VQELPKARVFGAARWLQPDKALIQVSLFYKSNDHFWFSFFHEAAHVLLHGKRELFVDVPGADHTRREESEANKFAGDFLIPENEFEAFVSEGDYSAQAVVTFSEQLGLAPGIVVGRLQHDKVVAFQTGLNRLKLWFKWKEPDARE
jgi:HTH-type transcriptional regulator / antitoxin HigA